MMEVFTLATLAAVGYQVTSLIRYLSVGQVREFVTGVLPWVGTFMALLVGSQAGVTENLVVFGDATLGSLNWASLLLMAVALGSTGSVAFDFKKALDHTDGAALPPLAGTAGDHE